MTLDQKAAIIQSLVAILATLVTGLILLTVNGKSIPPDVIPLVSMIIAGVVLLLVIFLVLTRKK